MDEKIAWYKEILELEPSSKIFFPLARLLQRDGHTDYAIEVLRTGLGHHKDFFEARLMLIELLHQTGSSKSCDAEVRTLLTSFDDYPQFWSAWGACLRHDEAQNDVSLAMRFIAASQKHSNISFASIIDKGLQSLEKQSFEQDVSQETDEATVPFSLAALESPETSGLADPFYRTEHDGVLCDLPTNLQSVASTEDGSLTPTLTPDGPMVPQDLLSSTLDEEGVDYSDPVQAMDYADFLLQEKYSQDKSIQEEILFPVNMENESCEHDINTLLAEYNTNAHDNESFVYESSSSVESMMNDIPLSEVNVLDEDISPDIHNDYHPDMELLQSISLCSHAHTREEESNSEILTLRTRSMAEVLTVQGDIQGALSIYDELLLTETSETMRREIQERVDVLRQNKACFDTEEGLAEPCYGKDKLLQMLTLLAERLDGRAQ